MQRSFALSLVPTRASGHCHHDRGSDSDASDSDGDGDGCLVLEQRQGRRVHIGYASRITATATLLISPRTLLRDKCIDVCFRDRKSVV